MKRKKITNLTAFLTCAVLAGCSGSTADIPSVKNFVPEKYMGTWYEIARMPHFFERGLDHVQAEYTKDKDGNIRVVNRGIRNGEPKEITGKARLKSPECIPPEGELEVSFFGPFYSDYRIIELPDDYSYAVVTGSTRNFLWILSRTPEMPETQLQEIRNRLGSLGFELNELEYPQNGASQTENDFAVP